MSSPQSALALAKQHVHQGRLSNGVSWVLWQQPEDVVLSLQVWVNTGSKHESAGQTGTAHMLEHLMFRGTDRVPDGVFDEKAESMGVSINAFTWLDYTAYTSLMRPESLDAMLELEADRFQNLNFSEDVFQAERDVVANERRQVVESNPDSLLFEHLCTQAMAGSSYAWPTIGYAEDIAAFTREQMLEFYRRRYASDRLCVVVVGDMAPDTLGEKLERTFGTLPARQDASSIPHTTWSSNEQEEPTLLRLALSAPRLSLSWPHQGRCSEDFAQWVLLNDILTGSEASRLQKRLIHEERMTLDATGSLFDHADPNLYELRFTLREGADFVMVRDVVREELRRLASDGPTRRELVAAQRHQHIQSSGGLATTARRAEALGESWINFGEPLAGLRLSEECALVTRAQVQELAAKLLASKHCFELHALPT